MTFLEMSITGSIIIVGILLLRKIAIHRLPKSVFIFLWGIAVVRLLIPLKIEFHLSVASLFAKKEVVTEFVVESVPVVQQDFARFIETVDMASETFVMEYLYYLLPIYVTGFVVVASCFLGLYLFQLKRFQNRKPIETSILLEVKENLQLIRVIRIYQSYFTKNPLTYGTWRPVILLPIDFDLTNQQNLEYVLAHECTHIKHFDSIKKLILAVTVSLHWFNPFVWLMYFIANYDIELYCDESVIKSGVDAKSYANSLVELLEISNVKSNVFSNFSVKYTTLRVQSIMQTANFSFGNLTFLFLVLLAMTGVFTTQNQNPGNLQYVKSLTFHQRLDYMFSTENVNFMPYFGVNPFDFLGLITYKMNINKEEDEFVRVSDMARMQTYQDQYGYGASKNSSGQSLEELGRQRAEAHMQELRDSGYLVEDGDTSWRVVIPISDDVKAAVEAYVENQYVNQQGWYLSGQESLGDISYAYTQTLEPSERLSAGWSVQQYCDAISAQYKAKINESNPNWPYDGSSYDPSIFDDFTLQTSLDVKA